MVCNKRLQHRIYTIPLCVGTVLRFERSIQMNRICCSHFNFSFNNGIIIVKDMIIFLAVWYKFVYLQILKKTQYRKNIDNALQCDMQSYSVCHAHVQKQAQE